MLFSLLFERSTPPALFALRKYVELARPDFEDLEHGYPIGTGAAESATSSSVTRA
jgi:hypothetical protein